MWQIVNIASPSPLLHLTDKGIEQIKQFLCFFPHILILLPLEQFLCFSLRQYVDLVVSPPFHMAGVWSSADDSMH